MYIYIHTQYNPLRVMSYNEFDPKLPQVKAAWGIEGLFHFHFCLGLGFWSLVCDACLTYHCVHGTQDKIVTAKILVLMSSAPPPRPPPPPHTHTSPPPPLSIWCWKCQCCKYTTLVDIQKCAMKTSHPCKITCEHSESAWEWRIALYKSDQQQQQQNSMIVRMVIVTVHDG